MSSKLVNQEIIPTSEELQPCANPDQELKQAIQRLNNPNADWNLHVEAVTNIRRVVLHHTDLISQQQKFKPILICVLDAMDNLRSLVSRNAMNCIGEMCVLLPKLLDPELDTVIPRLMKKYCESIKFYEEEADKALHKLTDHCSGARSLPVFTANASHKHATIRNRSSFFINKIVANVGNRILKYKDLLKLVQGLITLAGDANGETRNYAKTTLYSIYTYMSEADWEKLIIRQIEPNELRTLNEVIDKAKKADGNNNSQEKTPSRPVSRNAVSPAPSKIPAPKATTPTKAAASPAPPTTPTPKEKDGGSRIMNSLKTAVNTVKAAVPAKSQPTTPAKGPEPEVEVEEVVEQEDDLVFLPPPKATVILFDDMEENILVAVRLRPMNENERRSSREVWKANDEQGFIICDDDKQQKSLSYTFDYVYGQNDTATQNIYQDVGSQIVSSVMDGFNGTIFAYGQTNSGKTFTMMGTEDNPGFIPMAIEEVFRYIKESPEREFLLRVSYLEIYNEVINDLLRPEGVNLTIREDKKKGIFVEGLKEEIVVSPEHVLHVINSGEAHRHVASNDYNLMSSRSHTVFRMIIESNSLGETNRKNIRVSALTLIDLAGSEKVASENLLRRREGAFINKSLLTLGTIISKLSERKKGEKIGHLPYRDSKLTRILEPSLSGNSRIAIIATATPSSTNFEETNNTMKFASRAKKISNKTSRNADSDKVLMMQYKEQIEDLKKKLEAAEQAEMKLNELVTDSSRVSSAPSTDELAELRQELNEQESIRTSLEEKIKHLTKLILVSTKVDMPVAEGTGPQRRAQRSQTQYFKRARSLSIGYGVLSKPSPDTPRDLGIQIGNTRGSLQPKEAPASTTQGSSMAAEDEYDEDSPDSKKIEALKKINQALTIKLEAAEQQDSWKDKQIAKMKQELKERDSKIEALMHVKLTEAKSPELEAFKKSIEEKYTKQIQDLEDLIKEKDFELDLIKADNALLSEKLEAAENQEE